MFANSYSIRTYPSLYLHGLKVLGHKDKVYFAGGGGGTRYGVKNTVLTYRRGQKGNQLNENINSMDTGADLIQRMRLNTKSEIVAACADGNLIFYRLESEAGKMVEIARVKADFTEPDAPSLNDAKLNEESTLAISGGDDGILRVWDTHGDKKGLKVTKKFELISHTAPINGVDFHPTKPLVISASDDKSCRIFSLENQQLLKKLTLGTGQHDLNFKFLAVYFSKDEKHLFTVNNPSRGASFFTKWEMGQDNIGPVQTLEAHHQPISSCCINQEGTFVGLGGCDGAIKIVNLEEMIIENEQINLDMVVKGIDFTGDSKFLVAGTPESNFDLLQNLRPEGKLSKFMKLCMMGMLFIWIFVYLKLNFLG